MTRRHSILPRFNSPEQRLLGRWYIALLVLAIVITIMLAMTARSPMPLSEGVDPEWHQRACQCQQVAILPCLI